MKNSTTNGKLSSKYNKLDIKLVLSKLKNPAFYILAILFWLVIWHIISVIVDKSLILVSPVEVIRTLFSLILKKTFWSTIWFSILRIEGGFLLALIFGSAAAVIASALPFVRIIMNPLVSAVKAVPVASFVIMALLWISSKNLAFLISFLMVFPIVYSNMLNGILNTDKKLLEMAKVFRLSFVKKILHIYLPEVMPFFVSACTVSLGLCWKSGVAAEVIGQPKGSIGDMLYRAKIYLETSELFAWTVVIIFLSMIFEKLFLFLLKKLSAHFEKGGIKSCS